MSYISITTEYWIILEYIFPVQIFSRYDRDTTKTFPLAIGHYSSTEHLVRR